MINAVNVEDLQKEMVVYIGEPNETRLVLEVVVLRAMGITPRTRDERSILLARVHGKEFIGHRHISDGFFKDGVSEANFYLTEAEAMYAAAQPATINKGRSLLRAMACDTDFQHKSTYDRKRRRDVYVDPVIKP